jgi:hypothetical protein
VIGAPSKPLTKSATKRILVVHTTQETIKTPEKFIQSILSDDKDASIIELREHLKKAHFVIMNLEHENRELKKKSLENVFKKDFSIIEKWSVPSISTGSKTNNKGKAIKKTAEVKEIH